MCINQTSNAFEYSNEIVFRGHPDKVCDQISGALLRAYVDKDPLTRAGIEVMGGKGKVFITGEVTGKAVIDVEAITKRVLRDVGYDENRYTVINNLGVQSPDIAQGVDTGGAGDQGMMFGYACNDTPEMLPTAMVILQKFAEWYDDYRQQNSTQCFSDGKAQITGWYVDGNLSHIMTFLVSYQNDEIPEHRRVHDQAICTKIKELCNEYHTYTNVIRINPTGKFNIGGFEGDAGLTGRKIVVDAYQSFANVGGGNQNGKDATKVDFSGAHKARAIAKDYVKRYDLKWCEVQLSYAIGQAFPLGIYINSDRGSYRPPSALYEECTPENIIHDLKLLEADYEDLARFGHFKN